MRNLTLFVLTVTVLALPFCRKATNKTVVVKRDCTGTYLHFNDRDYKVCNTEMLTNIANGDSIEATFTAIKKCNGTANGAINCAITHEYTEWVEVKQIRK
jgi:hypothetical protein